MKQIRVRYSGLLADGTVKFTTPSGTVSGRFWEQRVKLADFEKIRERNKFRWKPLEIVRQSLLGDVRVFCSCPAFLYWGYRYIAWKHGFGLRRETRKPTTRNPHLHGSVCKHLEAVLKAIPFNAGDSTRGMKKRALLGGK